MTVDSFIDRIPNWLRWVLLLPGTVLVYLIVHVVVAVVGSFLDFMSGTPYGTNMTKYLIAPGFAGYWAVGFVYMLQPSPRYPATVVGTGFMMFLFGAASFYAVLDPSWRAVVPVVASTVGAWMAFVQEP